MADPTTVYLLQPFLQLALPLLHLFQLSFPLPQLAIVSWFLGLTCQKTFLAQKKPKLKPRLPPPAPKPKPHRITTTPPQMGLTNTPSAPPSQPATETRPQGSRKGNRPEEELPAPDKNAGGTSAPNGVSGLVPTSDMKMPGVTPGSDEKENLKIKIHLNLHARVRLDLDAQIYGDVVIGLL